MEIFDRLRQFEILSHFDGEQLDLLCSCLGRVTYEDQEAVLHEGEDSEDFFLIDQGEILIERNTPYGAYSLATLQAGELFGETGFVDRHARSGDAKAKGRSVLFQVRAADLLAASERNQRFAMVLYWALWKSLAVKLRRTNEVLAKFFDKTGPKGEGRSDVAQPDKVKVDIHAKKDLFREQTLSPMEINFLATLSREVKYGADEYIFREGDPGDHLYVVLEGRVMIAKDIAGAGEEALAFLGRGEYFGEMALIDEQPRSAAAKAHTDGAVLLLISRQVLGGILDIQKVSSLRLLKLLCDLVAKRLREVDDKLVGWYIFDAGSGVSLGSPIL